jgi:hypothetical protein
MTSTGNLSVVPAHSKSSLGKYREQREDILDAIAAVFQDLLLPLGAVDENGTEDAGGFDEAGSSEEKRDEVLIGNMGRGEWIKHGKATAIAHRAFAPLHLVHAFTLGFETDTSGWRRGYRRAPPRRQPI